MLEEPHRAILNREEPRALAEEHFARQIELLQDLANYGSNLIIRAFESSSKKVEEIVVCGVLLKQVVAMIDAAEVLLSAGCGHAAFLPARTAFEASIYIDWIFDSDSERRAKRYMVANYRDQRLWTSRAVPGTREEAAFKMDAQTFGVDILKNRPGLAAEAATRLAEINRVLAQPDLAPIDHEFAAARGKRKRDPEWYELDGLQSIRKVAEKVRRLAEYEFFYSKGSQVTHTATYKDHVLLAKGELRFKPIRHLADVNMLLNYLVSVALGTYESILKRYRSDESAALARKYVNDWRDPFMNVVSVKYSF